MSSRTVADKSFSGEKVRVIRGVKGIGVNELGRLLGVRGSAVSMWESGKRHPHVDMLIRLARALKVKIEDFYV